MEVTIKTNEMLNMNMKPMIKFTKSTHKIEILGVPIPLKYLKNLSKSKKVLFHLGFPHVAHASKIPSYSNQEHI